MPNGHVPSDAYFLRKSVRRLEERIETLELRVDKNFVGTRAALKGLKELAGILANVELRPLVSNHVLAKIIAVLEKI